MISCFLTPAYRGRRLKRTYRIQIVELDFEPQSKIYSGSAAPSGYELPRSGECWSISAQYSWTGDRATDMNRNGGWFVQNVLRLSNPLSGFEWPGSGKIWSINFWDPHATQISHMKPTSMVLILDGSLEHAAHIHLKKSGKFAEFILKSTTVRM